MGAIDYRMLLDAGSRKNSRTWEDLKAETTLLAIIIVLVVLIVVFFILTVREYLWAFHGISCCCRHEPHHRPRARRDGMDVPGNTTSVGDTTSSSSEYDSMSLRERKMLRRSWYEYSLAKYTQVVAEKDLVKAETEENVDEEQSVVDLELSPVPTLISVVCNDGTVKIVDRCCSICLGEFEVDETIVRSPLDECPHRFHLECLLAWLEKGKKRCPNCRHWFVPALKVADQIHAEFGDSSTSTTATGSSANLGDVESDNASTAVTNA
ncbi:expressed unknown protein [Seminavis robusta]|uniref:RING-type domain-containing protein n=1 Tax=Seminavis robusta TaxID=568900 RepID=A0A9N8F2P4_9STRA|nr:expressed unknown protein [Seminavis robusta]|eukprot:Sro3092_g343590.1 n/a (266) ;mRNA; r:6323-7395